MSLERLKDGTVFKTATELAQEAGDIFAASDLSDLTSREAAIRSAFKQAAKAEHDDAALRYLGYAAAARQEPIVGGYVREGVLRCREADISAFREACGRAEEAAAQILLEFFWEMAPTASRPKQAYQSVGGSHVVQEPYLPLPKTRSAALSYVVQCWWNSPNHTTQGHLFAALILAAGSPHEEQEKMIADAVKAATEKVPPEKRLRLLRAFQTFCEQWKPLRGSSELGRVLGAAWLRSGDLKVAASLLRIEIAHLGLGPDALERMTVEAVSVATHFHGMNGG